MKVSLVIEESCLIEQDEAQPTGAPAVTCVQASAFRVRAGAPHPGMREAAAPSQADEMAPHFWQVTF